MLYVKAGKQYAMTNTPTPAGPRHTRNAGNHRTYQIENQRVGDRRASPPPAAAHENVNQGKGNALVLPDEIQDRCERAVYHYRNHMADNKLKPFDEMRESDTERWSIRQTVWCVLAGIKDGGCTVARALPSPAVNEEKAAISLDALCMYCSHTYRSHLQSGLCSHECDCTGFTTANTGSALTEEERAFIANLHSMDRGCIKAINHREERLLAIIDRLSGSPK